MRWQVLPASCADTSRHTVNDSAGGKEAAPLSPAHAFDANAFLGNSALGISAYLAGVRPAGVRHQPKSGASPLELPSVRTFGTLLESVSDDDGGPNHARYLNVEGRPGQELLLRFFGGQPVVVDWKPGGDQADHLCIVRSFEENGDLRVCELGSGSSSSSKTYPSRRVRPLSDVPFVRMGAKVRTLRVAVCQRHTVAYYSTQVQRFGSRGYLFGGREVFHGIKINDTHFRYGDLVSIPDIDGAQDNGVFFYSLDSINKSAHALVTALRTNQGAATDQCIALLLPIGAISLELAPQPATAVVEAAGTAAADALGGHLDPRCRCCRCRRCCCCCCCA